MDEWLNFSRGDLGAGIAGSLIVLAIVGLSKATYSHGLRWLSGVSIRWSLKISRADLFRFEHYRLDRSSIHEYLADRLLWGISLLGAAMMFTPLAVVGNGLPLVAVVWMIFGMAIYFLTLAALGTLHRYRNAPADYQNKLIARVEELESKLKRSE